MGLIGVNDVNARTAFSTGRAKSSAKSVTSGEWFKWLARHEGIGNFDVNRTY